jgi:hypothetical protein
MAQTVAQHSVASFTTPTNGTSPIDANTVRGNDNTLRVGYNDHDSDPGIHLQSSALASRPSAGESGRKWLTTDTGALRLYFDTGSAWAEASYLSTGGGTVAGNLSVTGTLAVTGVLTATGGVVGDVTGNASTATALATARTINGVSFDGTANITVTAAAGTLTGSTLASGVTASSLTSVGTLANLTVTNPITGSVTGSSGSTTGNAATATALQTARTINGTSFNGTADITVTAAAGTLTGSTLASGVTASSLTSVGTLSSLAVSGTTALNGQTYTWPSGGGTTGQVLSTNGSGTLSWATVSGGGGTTTNSLTAGTYLTGGSFNGSAAVTFAVDATSANTVSKVVARDSSGNFSAGTITATLSGAAPAGSLSGSTLASGVTASSLTSVGTLTSLAVTGDLTVDTSTLKVDSTNNRVGVVTASPSHPLHVVGTTYLQQVIERATVSATAATGTIAYDALTQAVLFYTSNASANWTLNLRGSGTVSMNTLLAVGDSMTLTFMVTQGSTAYYPTVHQIDGTTATVRWQGGTAPTAGNASSIDIYTYTVIKTAATPTYTLLGSQTRFA